MAITSTINMDSSAGTITNSIFLNGVLFDTLVFSSATSQISFTTHAAASLSLADFLAFLRSKESFQNIISVSSYAPYQPAIMPFPAISLSLSNDGVSQLEFTFTSANHTLHDFTATYPSGTIAIAKRNQANSLSYAQWLYLINELNYFQTMVLRAYGL